MSLATLKTFDNPIAAHILRTRLESEGIPCYLFDEHSVTINPLYNVTLGGIKLKVNSSDLEEASKILKSIEATAPTNDEGEALKCPKCGSENFYSGFKSMKGASGILSAAVSLMLSVFPIYFKNVHKCKECNTEF